MASTQYVEIRTLKYDIPDLCMWVFCVFLQLLLECPDDIFAFEFCPSDPNIIVGGCVNGQVRTFDSTLYFCFAAFSLVVFVPYYILNDLFPLSLPSFYCEGK